MSSKYVEVPLPDSNWGWHSKWFYVKNHERSLPHAVGLKNRAKALDAVVTLRWAEGVTGIRPLWVMHKHQIQPLKNRVHPIFEYSDCGDSTWESTNELLEEEI
ncbi:hypothetical protein BAE44_0006457 [Dichanthelium oligosanthes]|uniref:Uncharacterized protein n=1 Tax=Dichanthelium oligosanthes TaxID=888268 RepID=A0A1E5W5A3_9POAL|nr:hypothetical protein BAE44_0006457 [Dichanthelium oligosanthes]